MKRNTHDLIYTRDGNHVPIGKPVLKEGGYGLEIKKEGVIGFVGMEELIKMIIHKADAH